MIAIDFVFLISSAATQIVYCLDVEEDVYDPDTNLMHSERISMLEHSRASICMTIIQLFMTLSKYNTFIQMRQKN